MFRLKCGVENHLISFYSSASQLLVLDQARTMMAQGTYFLSSLCPYECTRRIVRFMPNEFDRENLRGGVGLDAEGFAYPGFQDNSQSGFARFATSAAPSTSAMLHPLRMARNVSMATCAAIFEAHQLLAPHGVWLRNDDEDSVAAQIGDCGLFLGARSRVSAELWRAFYEYARLVLNLGHFESYVDDDIKAGRIHTAYFEPCTDDSSVCIFWSEFHLDDEEYSCRPKRDASNIVTPARLLAELATNGVKYPPPAPPPPDPPSPPPEASPPPGTIRCQLERRCRRPSIVSQRTTAKKCHCSAGAGGRRKTGRLLRCIKTSTATTTGAWQRGRRSVRARYAGTQGFDSPSS